MSEHSSEQAKETVTFSTKGRGVLLTEGADKENGMPPPPPSVCDDQFVLTFHLQAQPV